jgi:hypothetical protein
VVEGGRSAGTTTTKKIKFFFKFLQSHTAFSSSCSPYQVVASQQLINTSADLLAFPLSRRDVYTKQQSAEKYFSIVKLKPYFSDCCSEDTFLSLCTVVTSGKPHGRADCFCRKVSLMLETR